MKLSRNTAAIILIAIVAYLVIISAGYFLLVEKSGEEKRRRYFAAVAEAEEKARLRGWKARFPWKPTRAPEGHFTAEMFTYDFAGQFYSYDDYGEAGMAYYTGQDHRTLELGLINEVKGGHPWLKRFFHSEERFTSQFEQLHDILAEYGRMDDPVEPSIMMAIFRKLWKYNNSLETRQDTISSIELSLSREDWFNPYYYTEKGMEEGKLIAERLVDEIQGMDGWPKPFWSSTEEEMAVGMTYYQMLISGDPKYSEEILVPYEGWVDDYRAWHTKKLDLERASLEKPDRLFKTAFQHLFPPAGIKDGKLVDKDGDHIIWSGKRKYPFETYAFTMQGERVPLIHEEDGTIRVPTPREIDRLREEGLLITEGLLHRVPEGKD